MKDQEGNSLFNIVTLSSKQVVREKKVNKKAVLFYLTLRVNIIQNVRQTMQRICNWMLGVKSFKNWERKGSGFELNLVPRV